MPHFNGTAGKAAHRLALEFSKKTGMTLADAVILALEDEVGRTKRSIDRKRINSLSAVNCAPCQYSIPALRNRSWVTGVRL
jgi:hypothetical protein